MRGGAFRHGSGKLKEAHLKQLLGSLLAWSQSLVLGSQKTPAAPHKKPPSYATAEPRGSDLGKLPKGHGTSSHRIHGRRNGGWPCTAAKSSLCSFRRELWLT